MRNRARNSAIKTGAHADDHSGVVDAYGAVMLSDDDGLADLHLSQITARGMSPLTVRARRSALRRLAAWLGAPPMGASPAQVHAYLEARRRTVSSNTIRNELAHLRAYYSWLVRHDYRRDDPTAKVDTPRLVKPHVQAADDDALAEALEQADPADRAILALSAFAGLRAAEVASLAWRDIDTRRATITVRRGKGGRTRVVGLSGPVQDALDALPHREGPVIPRRDGRAGHNAPYQVSKRASALLGGRAGGFTLHQLRHRFATVAYAGTRDLRAVQDALGHTSPATTAIYAHTRREALQAAADAAAVMDVERRKSPTALT